MKGRIENSTPMKDLQHLGDMSQEDVILTKLLFDHTAMIILNFKKCILLLLLLLLQVLSDV